MRYPAPNYPIQAPKPKSNAVKIAVCVCIVIFLLIGAIAIALGVGLGVGLRNKSSDSSAPTAPTVSCTYGSSTCGCAATKPTFLSTKIINGYSATPHSWPWMVVLYYNNEFTCAGFLSNSYQFVITAAHCVYGRTESLMQIYAGVDRRSSLANAQVRGVSNWQIHPNYYSSSTTTVNDIAVIKLTSSFDKNDNVGLCCLPSGSTQLPIIGESGIIVGWGTTVSGVTSSVSDNLLQAAIQIQGSSTYCDISSTSDIQFCAGRGTSDTCQGDSGGPLMTSVNNLWTCTGIVSHGIGCGHSSYYTRVSYFRSFIDNAIKNL